MHVYSVYTCTIINDLIHKDADRNEVEDNTTNNWKISEWLGSITFSSLETTLADHNRTGLGIKYQDVSIPIQGSGSVIMFTKHGKAA